MNIRKINYFVVDAFTQEQFKGNPAAIVLLQDTRPDEWMQKVAGEINLSETAFIETRSDGFSLRWFTPNVEVDLCGHATLASAHVLWQQGLVAPIETIAFHTRSGVLSVTRDDLDMWLNFPSLAVNEVALSNDLRAFLKCEPLYLGKSRFDYLVQLQSAREVREFVPDFSLLMNTDARGLMITARGDEPGIDFVSRFFAPRVGVNEDPVTGSAHCVLAPFWKKQLDKNTFTAYQASKRGGLLKLKLEDERVFIGGRATTFSEGYIYV